MRWQAGTLSGWGILGLNLFQYWASDPEVQPLMGVPLALRDFPGISPLRFAAMRNEMDRSNLFVKALAAGKIGALETLYSDSERRKRIGARGAEWMVQHRRTWRDHAMDLKAHIKTLI